MMQAIADKMLYGVFDVQYIVLQCELHTGNRKESEYGRNSDKEVGFYPFNNGWLTLQS